MPLKNIFKIVQSIPSLRYLSIRIIQDIQFY